MRNGKIDRDHNNEKKQKFNRIENHPFFPFKRSQNDLKH
jgi:hypothetical protein